MHMVKLNPIISQRTQTQTRVGKKTYAVVIFPPLNLNEIKSHTRQGWPRRCCSCRNSRHQFEWFIGDDLAFGLCVWCVLVSACFVAGFSGVRITQWTLFCWPIDVPQHRNSSVRWRHSFFVVSRSPASPFVHVLEPSQQIYISRVFILITFFDSSFCRWLSCSRSATQPPIISVLISSL